MSTIRIKEKISQLVGSQFPEFVQADFTTFVSFIEAYYRFLEQDQYASEIIQNALSYNDIDRTVESFVKYFLNTYLQDIPQSVLANKKFLVKRIKDLYESKGSELSFKLLFRILFDTDIQIKRPYDNVLRASGGRWTQNFSLRVQTVFGDRNILTNRILTHTANGIIFSTEILRTRNLTSDLTELFLNSSTLSSSYQIGDLIEVHEGSNLVFSGLIAPTTSSVRIQQQGTGFKVGQLFNVTSGGTGTIIKISGVNQVGGITEVTILSYGFGYASSFFSGEDSADIITVVLDRENITTQQVNTYNSRVGGYGSSGLVLLAGPGNVGNYFLEDYVDNFFYAIPSIVATFNNDAFIPAEDFEGGLISQQQAVLVFPLGALAKYPGSYISDESFLSEFEVRLQDNKLYQPFAYQTNTDLDITVFFDIVKKLINPAGQIFFNNRLLQQDLDLSSDLTFDNDRLVYFHVHDSIRYFDGLSFEVNTFSDSTGTIDQLKEKDIFKFENELLPTLEESVYNLNKVLSDTSEVTALPFEINLSKTFDDLNMFDDQDFEQNISKFFEDLSILSDLDDFVFTKNIFNQSGIDDQQFVLEIENNQTDGVESLELHFKNIAKEFNETNVATDENEFNFGKQLSDILLTNESSALEIENNQNEDIEVLENSINSVSKTINNLTDTADSGIFNYFPITYVAENYFLEIYVADPPITFTF